MTRVFVGLLLCVNIWSFNANAVGVLPLNQKHQESLLHSFSQCVDHVSLQADTFYSYLYLWDIYTQFVFDQSKTFLPVCLLLPGNATSSIQGIRPDQFVTVEHRETAYVSLAQMVLGFDDTYDVFIHELAHFAGFLDEYPMRIAAAKYQCQIKRYAPNVIFKSQLVGESPHPYKSLFQSQLLTPSGELRDDIDKFLYSGCQHLVQTPAQYLLHPNQFNFLRFFDVTMIPHWYQYLWQQQVLTGRTAKQHAEAYTR